MMDAAAKLTTTGPRRTKAQRIADVKDVATRAGLSRGKAVESVGYGDIVRYAGDFVAHEPDHVEFLWRACSGAAHGDTWAILGLQNRESIGAANGVSTEHLTVSIHGLSVVAGEVVAVVEVALDLFDHRCQASV
jgi:hypothetical protein